MADKNTVKITVPVEFQAELNSLKKIESSLKETLNKTNPGSALAKELTASLTKLRPMIAEYEKLSISPEIDMTGIHRMQTLFQGIMREFEKTTSRMEFAPLENILPQEALNRINQLKTELAELQKQYANIEKHGSTEQATAYLTRTNKEDIITAARKTGKYRGEATLGQNVDIFAKEIENSKTNAAILTDKATALGEQYQQLENDLKAAKATLQEKWIAQARTQKTADQAAFYSGIGGFDIRYNSKTGERPTSGSLLTGQLEKMLRSSEFSDSGYLKGNMQSLMVQMLKDMNFDETEATAISKMQLDPMISAIRQHFSVTIDELDEAMPVAMMQAFEQAKGKASNRLAELKRQTEEQGITDINAANAKAHQAYKNQEKEVNKLKGETDAAFTKYEAAEYAADEANKATAAFESLHAALAAVAKEAQEAALALKKEEKEKKESEVEKAQTEEREKVQKPTKTSGVDPDAGRDNMAAGRDTANYQFNQKSQQQLEAEQFTANLKQSIKQWMSVSQVINLVKNGIRQAYQDIQGLDKAMTNIAVVTDMSIGDLWGKINDYMSIAQQYGVSTQGVYEVSQLYYQQGLGTADVMAATTETLKMARIAGMDYAEAADAMTVAIRSFKMEMSDAAHVTDVYSKVAAVTASDSEELAIAMSKTASSAESVGSSFENTTAMLAVMIETTRESAQNLGSALKSIISRYGEMKVGLTVDSEGEDIDYNKVDTALKSVGISIKDAQGQFRDFDEVIFELSEKWDGLDKNTQRYIATIMAGNRQQSRFIALVDNWERLDEVAGAAENSEDAGLLQYAKTLDSLETKLNNIKTSFQEFYMSIINGPLISSFLDFINKVLQGFGQLGTLGSIINIISIVRGIKSGLTVLTNAFSNSYSGIITKWKSTQKEWLNLAIKSGRERGAAERRAYEQGYNTGSAGSTQTNVPGGGSTTSPYGKNYKQRRAEYRQMSWADRRQYGMQNGKVDWKRNSWGGGNVGQGIAVGGAVVGSALSAGGAAVAQDNALVGSLMSAGGAAAQGASMGAVAGPWGALIGALIGALTEAPAVFDAINDAAREEINQLKKEVEEKDLERAKKTDAFKTLGDYINKYTELNKNRNRSADDYQAWLDINAEIAEKYPQYVSSMDAAGNAIVNLTKAEEDLASARTEALQANKEYYDSQVNLYERIIHNASTENVDKFNSFGRFLSDSLTGRTDSTRMQDVLTNMASGEALNAYELERGAWSAIDKALSAGLPFYAPIRYAITGETGYTQLDELLPDVDRSVDLNALKQNFKSFNLFSEETQKMLAENSMDMTVLDFVTAAKEIGATSASELKYLHSKYGSLSEEQALAQGATETQYLKVFLAKMMDENGLLDLDEGTFSETFEEAVNLSMSKRQLAMAKKGQITSGIELQMSYSDYGEKFEDISGYSLIMTQLAENIEGFDASVEGHFNQVVEVVADAYNDLRGSEKTKFETLMTNLDTYSINELDELFISLWGQNYEITHKEITDAIKQQFASDTYLSNERFIRAFISEDAQKDLLSLEDYASTIGLEATSDEAKVAYQEYLSNLAQSNQDIAKLYFNMSQQEKDWYSSTVAGLEDIITDEETTENQKKTAKAQQNLMYEYSKKLGDDVFSQEFQHSFSTDTGTGDWARNLWQNEDFHDELKLLGITSFEQLQDYVYENFSTYIGSLGDTVQSSIDSAKKFSESQEKGFDFDQALKLFNEIAEEGESWEDIFTYTEDGKLVLKDFEESMSRRYNLTIEELKSMNDAYKNGSQNLQEFLDNESRLSAWRYLTKEQLQGYGYTDEQIDDIINWINDDENKSATKKEFIAYLESNGMALEEAERFYEENAEAILKKQRETDFKTAAKNAASALEGEFDPTKQAQQIFASKGISGYSSSEAGELIAAGLFTQEDFTEALDGTYNLTAEAQEKLASMPVWIQNSVNQRIIESIDAAQSSMESLATNIGSGKVTEADYVEAFSVLQDQGWNLEDIANGVQYALMSAVAGKPEQLKTLVTKQIAKTKHISDDAAAAQYETEINKTVDTMAASFKDGYIERIKKYNDLLYEKIVGTASFSELEELEGLGEELNLNLEDFTGRLIDDLSTFAQAIIDNSYLSAEEKNKYLQDTYRSMLGADAYAQSYGLDPNDLNQDAVNRIADLSDATSMMLSSKNRMSLDQASEYAAALSNMVGIPSSVLRNAFNYNESDSTFSYDFSAGMTARDLQLKMLFETAKISENEEVSTIANSIRDFNSFLADAGKQAELVSAALQSGDTALLSVLGTSLSTYEELAQSGAKAEAFGKEARVNKFASSVEEFAGGQETTLEELTNLYSELGFTLSLDDAKKLLAQGPQVIAEHLIELANTAGYTDEDMAIIEDAMERGTQTLLEKLASVIDAAIEGTASFEDLTSLAKNAGIDLRGKVLKTAKGYGLTQEGMLAVSAARAGLSGDYTGEAQSLIEHYWGRQGLFSSEAAIGSALGGATMEQYQTSVDEATSAYLEANAEYIELLNKEETLIDDTTLAQKKAQVDEKKRQKNEAELQQHQAKVLLEAQKVYRKVAADKAANFMNEDPFKGATDTFATYLSNRDAARTAIEEAYKNNGLIDYTQAGQLINFIGYGAEWEPDQFLAAQQAILNANTEEGVNILSVMRQLIPELENLSDIEIWEEFGKLMDSSQKRMIEEEQAAISANQAFLKQYREQAKVSAAAQTEEDYQSRANAEKLQSEDGKIELSSLADDLRQTYGWNENQLTNDTIKELVQTAYGDEWQTVLAEDQGKLVEFLRQFNSLMSNFTYDESSSLSAEEQFNAYLKGETAAQEVNERLESLQAQLDGLVANPEAMADFSEDIDGAIEKVKELNELLYKTGMGFAWNTQIDGKTIVGTILTNESDITEAMGDANRESDIWENIATVHGFSKDKIDPNWLKTDGKVTGVKFNYGGYDYTYNFETFENIPGIGKDPNNEITYSGNFDEINTWLANNRDIIGTIVYKTPKEAFDSMGKQIEEIDTLINSLGDGESIAEGIYAGYDKGNLEILKQNIAARREAMKAAYGDTLEDNNGTLKVQTSFQINPNSDKWESDIKPRLDDLQAAGTVEVEVIGATSGTATLITELKNSLTNFPEGDLNSKLTITGGDVESIKGQVETFQDSLDQVADLQKDCVVNFVDEEGNKVELPSSGEVAQATGEGVDSSDLLATAAAAAITASSRIVDTTANDLLSSKVGPPLPSGKAEQVEEETAKESGTQNINKETIEEPEEKNIQDTKDTETPQIELVDMEEADLKTKAQDYINGTMTITDDNIKTVNDLIDSLAGKVAEYHNSDSKKADEFQKLYDGLSKTRDSNYYSGLQKLIYPENGSTELGKVDLDATREYYQTQGISFNYESFKDPELSKLISTDAYRYIDTWARVSTGDMTGQTLIASKYTTEAWNNMSESEQLKAWSDLILDKVAQDLLTGKVGFNPNSEEKDRYDLVNYYLEQSGQLDDSEGNTNYNPNESEKTSSYMSEDQKGTMNPFFNFMDDNYIGDYFSDLSDALGYYDSPEAKALQDAIEKASDELYEFSNVKEGETGPSAEEKYLKYMWAGHLLATYAKDYESITGQKYDGPLIDANPFTPDDQEQFVVTSSSEVKDEAKIVKGKLSEVFSDLDEELETLEAKNEARRAELNEERESRELTKEEEEEFSKMEDAETTLRAKKDSVKTMLEQVDAIIDDADTITPEVDAKDALTEIGKLQTRLDELTSSEAYISFIVKEEVVSSENKALPTISRKPRFSGQTQPVYLSKAAGNVNGIALAKGNVTSLINGAKIANKTLVGELGPELGVWDGQYHLLGQYGAEFVDMPSDAIVFNHKQTKGIVNGQWGHRGKALSEGNIKNNPLETPYVLDSWDALWGYSSFGDLINDLGKGSNKQINATITEDLEEWYNLLRKIAKLKAEISLIEAERANMLSGHEILRNYREQQALLHEQIATQKLLIEYQKEQLKLESDRIKQNEFWGKSLTFNEDGTLLSIFGNEANGGRGVFAFLDQLNELSGKQQVAMLEKLGYAYKDREGKSLEGEELVKQFITEYQEIVSHYNELDDSILSAESTIEGLITSINDLEQEIKDNQKKLEQSVYDILVEVAEREIEQIENQNALLKEANEKYVQGLTNALNKEQSLYEQNNAISNRESLQRQLSLLRRSGGSASEIEELERQLDETLKAEYFESQQKMIEDITKANENQVKLMENQVRLQKEALEYQKENGVIWTKVYEVVNGSYDSILSFFSGNSNEFFKASALEQESMLLEWAKIIGIYDENRASEQASKDAASHWNDGTINSMFAMDKTLSEYKDAQGNVKTKTREQIYNELSDEDKKAAQEHYNMAYTDAILQGKTMDEAKKAAYNSMVERLRVDSNLGQVRWDPHGEGSGNSNGSFGDGQQVTYYGGYTADGTFIGGSEHFAYGSAAIAKQIAQNNKVLVDQEGNFKTGSSPIQPWRKWYIEDANGFRLSSSVYDLKEQAEKAIKDKTDLLTGKSKLGIAISDEEMKWYRAVAKFYSKGGLVDYTGLAVVHGSKSKPEAFLNASQTAQIKEALEVANGKENLLQGLHSTIGQLRSLIHSINTINNSNNYDVTIAPGAVVINVDQLADSYDVDALSADIMNRMVSIASKATNRGVNRR